MTAERCLSGAYTATTQGKGAWVGYGLPPSKKYISPCINRTSVASSKTYCWNHFRFVLAAYNATMVAPALALSDAFFAHFGSCLPNGGFSQQAPSNFVQSWDNEFSFGDMKHSHFAFCSWAAKSTTKPNSSFKGLKMLSGVPQSNLPIWNVATSLLALTLSLTLFLRRYAFWEHAAEQYFADERMGSNRSLQVKQRVMRLRPKALNLIRSFPFIDMHTNRVRHAFEN